MKQLKITVNGKTYDVMVEETGSVASTPVAAAPVAAPTAAPVAAPAPAHAATPTPAAPVAAGSETITSPMPGTILGVKVNAGDAVKAGDVLLVLEAMKMENEIKAPHDATVAAVLVKQGDSVDSGADLVSLA